MSQDNPGNKPNNKTLLGNHIWLLGTDVWQLGQKTQIQQSFPNNTKLTKLIAIAELLDKHQKEINNGLRSNAIFCLLVLLLFYILCLSLVL